MVLQFRKEWVLRGQSQVVASVLLILVVIVASFLIISFVVPFVQDTLSGADCFEVVNVVKIKDNIQYTCYDSGVTGLRVQIHLNDDELIEGFQIVVESSGSSSSVEVYEGIGVGPVTMYDGSSISLPGKNEEKTYVIGSVGNLPDSVLVYPILIGGKTCDSSHSVSVVPLCS
jgi:flagellin-like protein